MPPSPSSPRFPSPPALSRAFDRVARGEWAELAFMAKAASLGLVACRPPGNSRPFDFLVWVPGVHAVRVQVKSAWSKCRSKYRIKATRHNRPYKASDVDVFVVYVPPENAWYVVPARVMNKMRGSWFFPHVKGSRSKFEKYREAWELLTEPREKRGMRVDLYACAEGQYPVLGTQYSERPETTEDTEGTEVGA